MTTASPIDSIDPIDPIESAEFEQVQILKDPEIGLLGFVAIHSTRLGPAFGGIRRKVYASPAEALADALRLAEHMSLKCAIQGIPGGGGKAVLAWRPDADRAAVYRRLGEYVEAMGGRFYTGPDVGTEPSDLAVVAGVTGYVTRPADGGPADGGPADGGPADGGPADGGPADGGPADGGPGDLGEATAAGVFAGIEAVVHRLGRQPAGAHVTVTGLGDVGSRLARRLAAVGARLTVSDIVTERVDRAVREFGAERVEPDRAHAVACDVFAPCALGGVVSAATLPQLGARAIAGSANNVLKDATAGQALHHRGVLYAPDFVINSGGLVQGSLFHLEGARPAPERVARIGVILEDVFNRAASEDLPPEVVAERMARERLAAAPPRIHLPSCGDSPPRRDLPPRP